MNRRSRRQGSGGGRTVRCLATSLLLLAGVATTPARAQLAFRLGAGPAIAGDVGLGGLVALELRGAQGLVVRAEGRPLYVSQRMEGGFAGGALGFSPPRASPWGRPYFLATAAGGVDLREADSGHGVGFVVGADLTRRRLGSFLELRYEHVYQTGARHYTLPEDQVMLVVGFRLGKV